MNDKEKEALIKDLTGRKKKNFTGRFRVQNQRWFVDKLIRVFEARGLSDAQIDQKVREVVAKSKGVVRAKRKMRIGLKENKSRRRAGKTRREEILYGAIAHHPDLIESGNSDLLDFIFKRRYRGVYRLKYYVNPNSRRGYFRYPYTCRKNQSWRVNEDAEGFWKRVKPDEFVPLTLKPPIDPVGAIDALFISKKNACKGNLFDCAAVLTIVLMDSLQEARDPSKLLNHIADRQHDFLVIYHPNKDDHPHFIVDSSPQSLFTKPHQPVEDMQVGDHIYIFNHPLYKVFVPRGSWRGEHSLLYAFRNRDVSRGFYFGGHGKQGTVSQFYNDFLRELQTYLHRSYRIGKIFLTYKISNDTSIPSSKVRTHDDHTTLPGGDETPIRVYEFDVDYTYRDYQKSRPKRTSEHGFLIVHLTDLNEFGIMRQKTIEDVLGAGNLFGSIPFRRRFPPTNPFALFDPEFWSIYYTDPSTQTIKDFFPFVRRKNNRIAFKHLTIDELFADPFGKLDPLATDPAMTLPKVDTGSAYQSFLNTNGAI